jgi:TatA/E family protein of Tat protein translocase
MPFGIGATEMLILVVVLLVVFGPKRLPEIGRNLGKGMRELKTSVSAITDEDDAPPSASPRPTPAPQVRERDSA